MRRARRAVLLVVVFAAVVAPQAASAAFTGAVPIHLSPLAFSDRTAGPVFAGDDAVVWGQPVRDGFELTVERGGASTKRTIPIPGVGRSDRTFAYSQVEASATRAALHLSAYRCYGGLPCVRRTGLYDADVAWELDDGELVKLAGCESAAECASAECADTGPVDVSDDVVAYDDCDGTHVRDFAPGATPAGRDYPRSPTVRVAGSIVALTTYDNADQDHPRVHVSNWRTGDELYSIANARDTDIQDDGTLAFSPGVQWASPAEPTPHMALERDSYDLRIAGDRIAARIPGSRLNGLTVEVADLNGSGELENPYFEDPWAHDGFDFDGVRVARLAQACLRSWLIVQNVAEADPHPVVEANCQFPHVVPGSGWLDRKHRLRVRLACPASPDVGCAGEANTRGTHRDEFDSGVQQGYAIRAGAEKTIKLRQPPKPLCRARNGRARARLTFSVSDRAVTPVGGFHTPLYIWTGSSVRARGHTHDLPRCTKPPGTPRTPRA